MAEVYRVRLVDADGKVKDHRSAESGDLGDVIDALLHWAFDWYSDDLGWFPRDWKLEVVREL